MGEEREVGDFNFWQGSFAVNRSTKKLGKIIKQKQSTR